MDAISPITYFFGGYKQIYWTTILLKQARKNNEKCNFNERNNYAHNFFEKHVLWWCAKNKINDESLIFLFFSLFQLAKI